MAKVAIVAGEASGDLLGAGLMAALRRRDAEIVFAGVGGPAMAAEGLQSLFPMEEVAVMGPLAIAARLRPLLRRIRETADHVVAAEPDVLVIVDSPEFTHRVARRVRKALPRLPIANYAPPTVWAWRSGRARAMRSYVDRALALLPFEPAAFERLGGPPCVYVGHPAVEAAERFLPSEPSSVRPGAVPSIVVLPGSRHSEVARLVEPFRETIVRLHREGHRFRVIVPAVEHLRDDLGRAVGGWPVPVDVVSGESAKWAAFSRARAALAASGTVTLELALAGVPMVVGYRVEPGVAWLAPVFRLLFPMRSVVMANLVLDENVVPEFIQEPCTPQNLAPALEALLRGGPERERQLGAFEEIRRRMELGGEPPSERAAAVVAEMAGAAAAQRRSDTGT